MGDVEPAAAAEAVERLEPVEPAGERLLALARRGQRRRNAADGARPFRVVVKLTPAEKALVVAMAETQRVSPPALFMRALLTGGTEAAAKYQRLRDDLLAARRLLAAVSSNVNQLARQANAAAAGHDVRPVEAAQLAAALDAVQRAAERIDEVAAAARSSRPAAARGAVAAGERAAS